MSIFVPGLLKDIHKKGGEGTNMLSQVSNPLEVDTSHPGFMLRRDLIRIIGNLAYQNKKNQDVVTSSFFFFLLLRTVCRPSPLSVPLSLSSLKCAVSVFWFMIIREFFERSSCLARHLCVLAHQSFSFTWLVRIVARNSFWLLLCQFTQRAVLHVSTCIGEL